MAIAGQQMFHGISGRALVGNTQRPINLAYKGRNRKKVRPLLQKSFDRHKKQSDSLEKFNAHLGFDQHSNILRMLDLPPTQLQTKALSPEGFMSAKSNHKLPMLQSSINVDDMLDSKKHYFEV